MNHAAPARAAAGRAPRLVLVGLAIVTAAIFGTLGHRSASSSAVSFADESPSASRSAGENRGSAAGELSTLPIPGRDGGPTREAERGAGQGVEQPGGPAGLVGQADGAAPPGAPRGALDEADGLVPDGASVFDDRTPAVTNLDPSLLKALRRAATEAARDGVEFQVNSGWRSPEYQDQLFRQAVSDYGSEKEAARWVATASTSAHVSGDAVDIGPVAATAWLSEHGDRYGLCQTYRNESWHYELRPEATSRGCPPMYADTAHDPRMQQ